ncbi:MAG: CoB--CoM heterodisulfide reductase iron-sulfur subunit A family protein [Deltaproteobacteria bacterium]|nr:CoB--CoM heterodisulfide reductase iron-sulfur subunit A family protein [Deltaproteobacteria bacterium]
MGEPTNAADTLEVDAIVVGGGITGLQAAVDLADSNHQVLIVERDPSIGGKMIALSKVFPTLDCSSCITTPKMAEAAHHPNIRILTWAELDRVTREDGGFRCEVTCKPRYVVAKECIGCRQCEYECPVVVPNDFEGGQGARRAIYIPHSNAWPQVALINLDDCIYCGKCVKVCPTQAVDFGDVPRRVIVRAGAVLVASGYELTSAWRNRRYGAGELPNVIGPLLMERLIAPHGPYGKVLRPSDGRIPDSIAYVQCAGSRDASTGYPYCSRVCCMYAVKQAILLSGSLPLVDITIYYMDIRAFGKGFETFYQDAKAMGIQFVCGKVASITEDADHNPLVRVERKEEGGEITVDRHDLVVLSLGMEPAWKSDGVLEVGHDGYGFVDLPDDHVSPTATDQAGVFVAGTASAPKDIVDSIVEAGAAASRIVGYLRSIGWSVGGGRRPAVPGGEARVGVSGR